MSGSRNDVLRRYVWVTIGASVAFWLLKVWLALFVIGIVILFILYYSDLSPAKFLRQHVLSHTVSVLLFVTIITSAIKVLLVELYSIPSASMENTFRVGDNILISKLHYGPRLPRSNRDIPWYDLFFSSDAKVLWDYRRLSGFSRVRRNDIVVFETPEGFALEYVKRCTGLPGDTISVVNGHVFVNGVLQKDPSETKNEFRVHFHNAEFYNTLRRNDLGKGIEQNADSSSIILTLTSPQKNIVSNFIEVDSITEVILPPNPIYLFPNDSSVTWSLDQFGPVMVPYRGMTINLNFKNYAIYQRYFNKDIQYDRVRGYCVLNGGRIDHFTFENDYFFFLGDNRHQSIDSRYIGFVRDTHLIGKAILVLYPFTNLKVVE